MTTRPETPSRAEMERQMVEAFKRINGFTDRDVEALSRYCLGQTDEFPRGLEK